MIENVISNPLIYMPLLHILVSFLFAIVLFVIIKRYYAEKIDEVLGYVKEVDAQSRKVQMSIMEYVNAHLKSVESLRSSYETFLSRDSRANSCPYREDIDKVLNIEKALARIEEKLKSFEKG